MNGRINNWIVIRLIFYIISITFFVILPWDYLAHGPVLCVFRRLWGITCLGCGMTRACWQLLHLDFASAWQYNKLVIPVIGFFLVLIHRDVTTGWRIWSRYKPHP